MYLFALTRKRYVKFLSWIDPTNQDFNSKVVSTHLWNTPLNLYQQAVFRDSFHSCLRGIAERVCDIGVCCIFSWINLKASRPIPTCQVLHCINNCKAFRQPLGATAATALSAAFSDKGLRSVGCLATETSKRIYIWNIDI